MNALAPPPPHAQREPAPLRLGPWACLLCLAWALSACAPAHRPDAGDSAAAPGTPNSAPKDKDKPTAQGSALPPRGTSADYGQRDDAMAWADGVASRTDLPRDWVRNQIAQARRQAAVIRAVTPAPSGTEKNWATYRARFIEPTRTEAGLAFWKQHADTLARAEKQYGVPASLIVGVIGVETLFGRHLGQHRVIDALATLAFDFPTAHPREPVRTAFFQQELLELLLLSREQHLDPLSLRGSYAGAMGWPQFIPSSWRRYAVDFDRDGRIDLINNPVDVIGSVANYFVAFGWKPGMPTHYPVQVMASPKDLGELLAPDILPTFDVNTFVSKGAVVSGDALKHAGPLALVLLENGLAPPTHIAGTHNFYVVTRYNWSSYYALAVIELGEHIQAVRLRPAKPTTQRAIKAKTKPARSSRSR
ncbi:MAG: lytic murein transglycosylase B [Hydrogenophaga sp.]|nr:lytic murein transglycosylase B [Hydrogenophaga sp.]